jgi:peptidoglycan/xylan/chitin deacetylase (PgdA/CDA1 family)
VNDHDDPFFEALPVEVFDRQMRLIARHYVVLPVEELVDRLRAGTVPRNAVAITFDDGYRDVLTHAAPILARYHLPATVFLATGFVGTGDTPWYDRLATALKWTSAPQVAMPFSDEVLPLDTRQARLRALGRLQACWKALPEVDARKALDTLLESLGAGDHDRDKNAFLRWDEVHALRGLGFCIGAHTVSHPILSRVSMDRARAEIMDSRRAIEARCGVAPRAFAYPNGGEADYTSEVVELVRPASA